MFNPTKAHEKFIEGNQYRLRLGSRVPKDAVSLAYSYTPPISPAENVQVADMSGFVLENITSGEAKDMEMYPNYSHMLRDRNLDAIIPTMNFLLTNVFKDGKPLYYVYEAKFETVDSKGPDAFGFYQGNSISLVDRYGEKVNDAHAYKVMLKQGSADGLYRVCVFTSFQTQPSDMVHVVYTAMKNGVSTPGHTELITPQPAFRKTSDISEVINSSDQVYYQMNGSELGQSMVAVPQASIPNRDYRTPVAFNFRVVAFYTDGTTTATPYFPDEVYNAVSVVDADEFYHNGFKRLQGKTAAEIAAPYLDSAKEVDYYAAESQNSSVELYTQPDGQNYVLASTNVDTGHISLPDRYAIEYIDGEQFFSPIYSIKLSDTSQIKVLPPMEKTARESWYLRIKNGRFVKEAANSAGFPIQYRYTVPEYYIQPFDSVYGMPYKKVMDEKPSVVGERKIRVRFVPLYIIKEEGSYNISVVVNGIDANVKSWDILDGTVELDTKVKENDNILVTYYYEEQAITYRGYWDAANQRFWHLDLNPSNGHLYTDVHRETGEIIDVPSFGLINKTVYLYIKPSAIYSENGLMVGGSYQAKTLFHSFVELEDKSAILLAKIRIRPNSSIDSVKLVDTRKRGGGLKEHIGTELMKELCPDSQHYWDIGYWDGEPYSENGVGIVRLPKYILAENGGRFSVAEVEAIVNRHLGFGNLALIEFVEEPERLLRSPMNGTIDVTVLSGE